MSGGSTGSGDVVNGNRRTVAIVGGVLVGLGSIIAGGAAQAGQQGKADVCHRDGRGEWRRITVSMNAVDAHRRHGDALVGESVPGVDGMTFDERCDPVGPSTPVPPAVPVPPAPEETILAVAYTDMEDDGGPYDPNVDVLIAKLVDGADGDGFPGAGDTVVTHRYPTTLTSPFVADAFESFAVTGYTVVRPSAVSAVRCGVIVQVGDRLATISWFSDRYEQGYLESFGPTGPASLVADRVDFPGWPDTIDVDPESLSRPATELLAEEVRQGDQGFVDVETDCVVPAG